MHFGGGASESFMTPAVLAITIIAALLVLLLPRKYVIVPLVAALFLTPVGQQLVIGGNHFYVPRILALVGAIRLILTKLMGSKPLFGSGLNGLDKLFLLWVFVRGLAFILLFKERGAVINQAGLWLDAFGGYFLFRFCLQGDEDVFRAIKVFAAVAAVLASCMLYEFMTRINVFSYLAGHTIVPWLRNNRVRAQAVFANSITAGTFGATLLPLFYWLWKKEKVKAWGIVALVAASIIAVTSMASTPITGYLAGIMALCLWPIRRNMRLVRWGLACSVLLLALVMNAPVWFIITKVNIAGGDSWDRANLIQQTVHHFSDWWLWGTNDNANWGDFTWDQCNQFAAEALQGGLATLILFVLILRTGFSRIGKYRKLSEAKPEEWYFWCFGAALFVHTVGFLGIDYFDQTRQLWFGFLAMISAATYPVVSAEAVRTDSIAKGIRKPWERVPADPGVADRGEPSPLGKWALTGGRKRDIAKTGSTKLAVGVRPRKG
jgi:hypothetical protein